MPTGIAVVVGMECNRPVATLDIGELISECSR